MSKLPKLRKIASGVARKLPLSTLQSSNSRQATPSSRRTHRNVNARKTVECFRKSVEDGNDDRKDRLAG